MLKLNHKKIQAWQLSIELVTLIYHITAAFPKEESYGIVSQMRRAAISIPSNIAEGSSRVKIKERTRFLEIARSSLVELDTQIIIAQNLGFLSVDNSGEVEPKINSVFALLSKMMNTHK